MATAKERLKIFENVISRIGVDGDVLGEYSKAMAQLNSLQTYQEMNPPQMPQAPISTPMGGSIPPTTAEPTMPQNEGQGALNLPPQM